MPPTSCPFMRLMLGHTVGLQDKEPCRRGWEKAPMTWNKADSDFSGLAWMGGGVSFHAPAGFLLCTHRITSHVTVLCFDITLIFTLW